MLKHTPNILTVIRLLLIPPFLVFLYYHLYNYAFYTFIAAGVTDCIDGWLARFFQCQSFLGSLLDPIADKILIASSFISLALVGLLPWWLVILVFLRDLTISFGVIAWYLIIKDNIEFKPTYLSKLNTLLQIILLSLCLLELTYSITITYWIHFFTLLTTFTTLSTYIDYVWTWGRKAFTLTHAIK